MHPRPVIGIDASRATAAHKTGVERYAFEVIQELKRIVPPEYTVRLYSQEPLTGPLAELPSHWENAVLTWPPKRLWTQIRLAWEMLVRPTDVLWIPASVPPWRMPSGSVVTLHDVAFMPFPTAYRMYGSPYNRWASWFSVRRASRILTVSEFSKAEIVRWFRARPERVVVTPLAIRPEDYHAATAEQIAAVRTEHGLPERYFLYVGRLEKKKNLAGLLKAMREYATVHPRDAQPIALVGVPGSGFDAEWRAADGWPQRDTFVKRLGFVPQEDMAALYAGATALLLPSWYEGFGLPVLEAWACGTPVIAARAGSLPEIGGDAAVYVDPARPEQLADMLADLADHPEQRDTLRAHGKERLAAYAWAHTAQQTWDTLRAVADMRA